MSATTISNVKKTFTATETIGAYLLTKIGTDGTVAVATKATGEVRMGFSDRSIDSGDAGSIVLLNGGGTAYGTLSETVTNAGIALYGAASGKLGVTASGGIVGYSAAAGGSADDVVEIILA